MADATPLIGSDDAFRAVETWDEEQARYWTDALNQRAAAPDQIALRACLLEYSGMKPGDTALELGCGTGRLLADLARATGASGRALGLEPQPSFVKEAERFIREHGLAAMTRVLSGRAEEIPLAPSRSAGICGDQLSSVVARDPRASSSKPSKASRTMPSRSRTSSSRSCLNSPSRRFPGGV